MTARQTGSRSNKLGQTGQDLARYILQGLGFGMVEPVNTAWKIIRDTTGRIVNVFPVEKVSGDFRAVAPGGRSVLVEVKLRDRNLRWTDLEEHQIESLNSHAQLGGLSLLVWIHRDGSFVLAWPIPDFGPRASLTAETAARLDRVGIGL